MISVERRRGAPAVGRRGRRLLAAAVACLAGLALLPAPVEAQSCTAPIEFRFEDMSNVDITPGDIFAGLDLIIRNEGSLAITFPDASMGTAFELFPSCSSVAGATCTYDPGFANNPGVPPIEIIFEDGEEFAMNCWNGDPGEPYDSSNPIPPVLTTLVRLVADQLDPPPPPTTPVGSLVRFELLDGLTLGAMGSPSPSPTVCAVNLEIGVNDFNEGFVAGQFNLTQQLMDQNGTCPGGLIAGGIGTGGVTFSDQVVVLDVLEECVPGINPQGEFDYLVTASVPAVPPAGFPPGVGVATLENCEVIPGPGESCGPLSTTTLASGQSATATCSSPDVLDQALVRCNIQGQPPSLIAEDTATAPAPACVCDVQLDRQVSCDGGLTWVDGTNTDPADAEFDDGVANFCATTNAGQVKVRWVAIDNSFEGNDPPADVICTLDDGNPLLGISDLGVSPNQSVLGATPGVLTMVENQCAAIEDSEPPIFGGVTAAISCECEYASIEEILTDSDEDTAGFECREPTFEVTKVCEPELDPQTGQFLYTVTVNNTGGDPLTNCQVVDSAASGCDTTFPGPIAAGDSRSITCASEFYTNVATVTCDGAAPREAAAECPVDLAVDKQVSCDSGATWHDAGPNGDPRFRDGVVEGCTGWLGATDPGEQILVRYFAQSTGYLVNCTLFDTNTAFVPAGGIPVANSPNGPIFETGLIECNPDLPGWEEPNTATLACECLPDPQLPAEPVADSDSANIDCLAGPEIQVSKECRSELDPASGLFVYDVTITNAAGPGAEPLTNCSVTDSSASGCDRAAGSIPPIAPGQSETISCTSEYYTNTATVSCEGPKGPDFPLVDEASAECPVDLKVDKQVSCDSGTTWHDAGPNGDPRFHDGIVEGCTGLRGSDPDGQIKVRYFAESTGYLVNCKLFDDNTVFIPADGIDVADSPNGPIFETGLIECNPDQQGWKEPDTATLVCECLPDPQSPGEPVEDSDTANIDCEICEVKVDKQISCSSGWTFSDVGFDDGQEESCVGWIGQDEIVYRYEVTNTGTLPVASCTLVDTNETVGASGVIPIDDALDPGETASYENPLLECQQALDGGEPDTATYTCSCVGFEDRSRVSNSDSADLECRTADLAVTKTCDPQAAGENQVTITYENVGDADLVNCIVEDEIFLDDPECPADVGSPSPIPVSPASGIDLGPGERGTSTGVVFDLADRACNRTTVTCEIDGALDETGQVKTITGTADDLCMPQGQGCYTRTPGFWGTHPRVTEIFLPVSSCGLLIDRVEAAMPGSATEDLCWGGQDFAANGTSPQQLQLIRQCTAAALNFNVTQAAGGDCEGEFPGITQAYGECCAALCNGGVPGPAIGSSGCIETLDAFNNSVDSLSCDGPNALPYPFCPGLGANGFQGEPALCSEASGNGFVNPGRNLGLRARRGLR